MKRCLFYFCDGDSGDTTEEILESNQLLIRMLCHWAIGNLREAAATVGHLQCK